LCYRIWEIYLVSANTRSGNIQSEIRMTRLNNWNLSKWRLSTSCRGCRTTYCLNSALVRLLATFLVSAIIDKMTLSVSGNIDLSVNSVGYSGLLRASNLQPFGYESYALTTWDITAQWSFHHNFCRSWSNVSQKSQ